MRNTFDTLVGNGLNIYKLQKILYHQLRSVNIRTFATLWVKYQIKSTARKHVKNLKYQNLWFKSEL